MSVLGASSQTPRRRRATTDGRHTTTGDAVAAEARDIVRRAVGDAAGLTVKGQVRRAAEHLGLPAENWRVREAWYGRAGAWSAAALDELRARLAEWEACRSAGALAERVAAVRRALARLSEEVDALAGEVGRLVEGAADA